jgi:VWFA-related protein
VPFRSLVVAAVSLWLLAPQAPLLAQGATFKSGVDLVRFDVRITDDAGRPITDLKPEEIVIEESGRSQSVLLFQRITEPAESYVEAAMRAVTAQVSSNDAFPRGHLYILLFDQEHISPGNEGRARMAAEAFIRRNVRPSDRVALFALPGPGPQLGFTGDKTRAIKELASIRGTHQRVVDSAVGTMAIYEAHRIVQGDEKLAADLIERMSAQSGADVAVGGGDLANVRRPGSAEDQGVLRRTLLENARVVVNQSDSASRQFLQRLADVLTGFRDIEGRKTVVMFSEGFFQDNLSRELETVAAAAAQSYCVFYTFDLNARGASLEDATAPATTMATEIQTKIAPLATLAVETDGMMLVDAGNRSEEALQRIAAQSQDYYLVGFAPSEQARTNRGKYQRVTIKVTRPGARVSARTGYALPPETTLADKKRAINSVLSAPFAQQGLRLDYTTYVMKAADPGAHRVVLSLAADLPIRSSPADSADVVFVARDVRDGRVVASGSDTIPLPEKPRAGAALGSGTWRVQFDVPAGSYMMRTVVREPGGLVGSADRRIEVRPLDGPDVTASDLVLGSALGGLPVHPRAYAGDGLNGVLETYARDASRLEGLSVTLELRRLMDSSVVTTIPAELRPVENEISGGVSRRASFVMPLTSVPPGEYVAHAVVTSGGEVVAERTRQLEVLDGSAPAAAAAAAAASAPAVSPLEITRGDLGQRYLRSLQSRAQGTPAAEAARRAVEGRWEEAEAALRRTGDTPAAVPDALRGFALFVREDYAGAAAALQRSQDAEANALTAFFLGWAQEGARNTKDAISAWRAAAHLDPTLVSAHLALADGYLRLSQRALAIQALKAGLTAIPASHELQTRLQQLESSR